MDRIAITPYIKEKGVPMRILPALAVLSLLAGAATADPAPGSVMKAAPPAASSDAVKACLQNFQLRVVRVGQLGARLKLTAQQQPLFDAWRKTMLDVSRASPCPAPPTGLGVPTPQRLENQIKMLDLTLNGLRKEQPAADALYATLSPDQRAVFDGPAQ